jgi:DNA polymerase-3 subunit delta'
MQFSQVIGQESLKKQLIADSQHNKISHAQLILGNSGYGTLPITLAFIQYLFCENKGVDDSCGNCPSCHKVSSLQHPDLHFSFPAVQAIAKTSDSFLKEWREINQSSPYFNLNQWTEFIDEKGRKPIIGTEESQEIIKKLSLKSFEGGYKVMVIWMADEMNATCSNKLLKILEEPPAKTLFFLIASSSTTMLPTIISRTRIVKVPRLTTSDIANFLVNTKRIEQGQAISLSAQADGNLITALDLISDDEAKNFNREQFIQFMRVCYSKKVVDIMNWSDAMSSTGKEKQKLFLEYALHMFRQSILKNYTENQLTKVSPEEAQFLANFSRFITGNNIVEFMTHFSDAHYHIDRNANPKILFTDLSFKVMRYIHFA